MKELETNFVYFLIIYGFTNDAVTTLDYIESNIRIISE
jgi:hypothetical protein